MNGLPIISPWNSCARKCPFNVQLAFAVAWLTLGAPPGSHQHFTSAFQFPTKASSALCAGPGVPAASIFFIISALSASDFPEPDFFSGRSRTAVLPPSSIVCFITFSLSLDLNDFCNTRLHFGLPSRLELSSRLGFLQWGVTLTIFRLIISQ